MKKLIIALVLALVMLVPSSTVFANGPIEPVATGDSTAEWTDEEAVVGEGSAKLSMPSRNWYIDPISNAEAQIDIEDTLVGDISGFSFHQKVDNVDLPVCIEFNLNEGKVIRGYGLDRSQFPGGDAPSTDWFQVDESDVSFGWRSWDYYQDKYSDYIAETVDIGYNPIGSMQSVIAYIDDFILNGITYAFEPPPPEPILPPTPKPEPYNRYKGLGGVFWVEVFNYSGFDTYKWDDWSSKDRVLRDPVVARGKITGVNAVECALNIPEGTHLSFPGRPGTLVTSLFIKGNGNGVHFEPGNIDFSQECSLKLVYPDGMEEVTTFTQIRDGLPVS